MVKMAIMGECMLELSGAPFSQTLIQNYGGDTLNTAVYLSRLLPGDAIYYVTALGNDLVSQRMQQLWRQEGVQLDHVLHFDQLSPGLYWILLDDQGERSFMYWRNNSAASQWLKHPEADHTLSALLAMEWVYLSGISLAILDKADREKLLNWLAVYRDQGGKIAFDSNYRPILWSDRDELLASHRKMLSLVDLALLTNDDECAIWQMTDEALIAHLATFHCPILILKQGAKGALVMREGEIVHIPATHIAKIVDSTAAGDSFNAGLLAGLVQKQTIEAACYLGHRLAGTVIQHKGAIIPEKFMP